MNYLETGLPHTDFIRRKTDFSPPRFIPLCKLGRKYRGLESLTRREVGVLVNRLSEPKKNSETEDPVPALSQVQRKATPGTGRFVGQKKMSSFEIEKMVDRLYSRRATKDYSFVDETVEADDILNMTNRDDVSDDSESEAEENKYAKDRKNSILKGENCAKINTDRKQSITFKMDSGINEQTKQSKGYVFQEIKEITTIPPLNLYNKPKSTVRFQRAKTLIETKKENNENQFIPEQRRTDCLYSFRPDIKRSKSSPGQRSQSSPTQRSQSSLYQRSQASPRSQSSTGVNLTKAEVSKKPEQKEENRNSFGSQSFFFSSAELTRPSPSSLLLSSNTPDSSKPSKDPVVVSESRDQNSDTANSPSPSKKVESPRQKGSNVTQVNKPPRYAVAPCDELLIDRVATYNRSPRLRSK